MLPIAGALDMMVQIVTGWPMEIVGIVLLPWLAFAGFVISRFDDMRVRREHGDGNGEEILVGMGEKA